MRYLIISVLLLYSSTVLGQNIIQFEEDTVSQSHNNLDLINQFHEFKLDLVFTNNTNDSLQVNWRREFGESCPTDWEIYTADPRQSYIPTIMESPIPFTMPPGSTILSISQFFSPNEVAGCCDLKMIFSLEGAPDIPIDTGYFHLEINESNCSLTSLSEVMLDKAMLYPNPSLDIIHIESDAGLESIHIFDLQGKLYFENYLSVPNSIDISTFPKGMYLCMVKGKADHYTMAKFIKN